MPPQANRRPLSYRKLRRAVRPFGVREIPDRGKGSERMLGRLDEHGKGPKWSVKCHGLNTELSVDVIETCLRRLGFTELEIEKLWATA